MRSAHERGQRCEKQAFQLDLFVQQRTMGSALFSRRACRGGFGEFLICSRVANAGCARFSSALSAAHSRQSLSLIRADLSSLSLVYSADNILLMVQRNAAREREGRLGTRFSHSHRRNNFERTTKSSGERAHAPKGD